LRELCARLKSGVQRRRFKEASVFKANRIIAWVILVLLVYALLQHLGILPNWAPHPFRLPKGPPAA